MHTNQATSQQSHSRDSLRGLDSETMIDMYLALETRFQHLGDYVRDLVAEKYGRKTEHFESPGQLLIFPTRKTANFAEALDDDQQSSTRSTKSEKASKPGHGRNEQLPDLPHVSIMAPVPSDEKLLCTCCGAKRIPEKQILQSSRYQFVPASFFFEDLFSVVYGCPSCDSADELVAVVPEAVKKGLAAPGLKSNVAVSRDFDHIPFNRQSEIYRRHGVNLSRSTLSDFYAQVSRTLIPIYDHMHKLLLLSKVISTDDTPVKVLDRTKKMNIKRGRKWAFLGDAEHPVNLFLYTHSRGRDGPMTFLKGWNGSLQGDCFSGNIAISAAMGTTLVACIAHARRYFIKALLNDRAGCNQALSMFQALYEIERTANELDLSNVDRGLMRKQESAPLLNEFQIWLENQYASVSPKSTFGKALFYCINNWKELTQYVNDGSLKIDNNHTEREMKYIAMGRKAWLFFGSDKGAQDHAVVLSVLSTCRRHGVEPWTYLTDVQQRLIENPNCDIEELLPFNWKQKHFNPRIAEIPAFSHTPQMDRARNVG